MKFSWTNEALLDLVRLYDLLASINQQAAAHIVQILTNIPMRLLENLRIGRKLTELEPRKVRRIIVSHYKIRYEIHTRLFIHTHIVGIRHSICLALSLYMG